MAASAAKSLAIADCLCSDSDPFFRVCHSLRRQQRSSRSTRERLVVGVNNLRGRVTVAEVGLGGTVGRTLTGTKEGRDGDRDENGNDEHDHHELDERKPVLVGAEALANGLEHVRYAPFVCGLEHEHSAQSSRRIREAAPGNPADRSSVSGSVPLALRPRLATGLPLSRGAR